MLVSFLRILQLWYHKNVRLHIDWVYRCTLKTWSGWLFSDFCAYVGKTCNAIILVTTCNSCIVCIPCFDYNFFTWDKTCVCFCFKSHLFYGKFYVTKRNVAFSFALLERISCEWKEIVSNDFFSSKTLWF